MLSVNPLGKAGVAEGAAAYFEQLAREDYYENGGEPPGQWMGRLADTMGLAGDVREGQLRAMFQGFHPETGEALAKNAGPDHKAGWDLSYSAPKSLSTVWAVAGQDTRSAIQAAQDEAVKASLSFLEQHAFSTRDRQGNSQIDKLLAAAFPHSTSREQDPQLHTHLLVANLGQRLDGSWAAVDFDARWKMAAGAVYRAELAARLQALGFQTMRDGDSFKVVGVPASLVEEFSKRRAQIVEALAEKGYSSAKAAEVAALDTRAAKGEISREELFQQWQETALAHGFSAENIQQLRKLQEQHAQEEEQDPLSREALFAQLTETDSAYTIHKIYQVVSVAAQGKLDAGQIEARVQNLLADPDMVKLRRHKPAEEIKDKRNPRAGERHYSTREMVELEKAMAARAAALSAAQSHVVRGEAVRAAMKAYELKKGFQLSLEQRAAVLHITTGSGQLAAVRGAAGAGKTTFMEPARIAWESAGHRVRGTALAGKAAAGMETAGIKSQTMHSLLHELDGGWLERLQKLENNAATADKAVAETLAAGRQPSERLLAWQASTQAELAEQKTREVTARDVVLVDEAGMIGSRQMSALMQHAEKIGFKLVLIGDEKQLQAVAAGGAFQVAQREAGHAELSDNRRQRDAADREAARAVVAGQAGEALRSYLDRDRIHINADQRGAAARMAKDWAECKSRASEKLMLAKTRAEVRLLNYLAREEMKSTGRLINAVTFSTAAGQREFAEGDRLLFTKNDRELRVKNGHLSTIERIDFDPHGHARIHARMDHDGSLVTIIPGLAQSTQSKQKEPFTHIEHGYAVTTHKAQGVTVDRAFVLGLGDREMGYVQMTRHRDECHIYITAREIDKLEEAAEVALAEQFGDAEATPKMLDFMQQVAARRGIAPSQSSDFVSVRLWLDQHSPIRLGLEQDAGEQGQKEKEDTDPRMARLRGAISSLEASHQKGTTLDYSEEEDGTRAMPEDLEDQIKMQGENAERAVAEGRIPEKTDTHQPRHGPAPGPELQLEHVP